MTVIKAKTLKFSELNDELLTKSNVIFASALRAMTIFNTSGISIRSFGITKLHSCCFAIIKIACCRKNKQRSTDPRVYSIKKERRLVALFYWDFIFYEQL
ncbi:hypothetical protein [Colwellia sp. MEBiC06753]